jgi:hypothetical protein
MSVSSAAEARTGFVRLRPYQIQALERVQARIAAGVRRIVIVLATGGGKTTIAVQIILEAISRGQCVLFLAHRRELISQTYRRLVQMGVPEAEVGVLMGNDPRRRPGARVQVASVDTLRNRAKPRADIVFIDECHRALARSYQEISAHYPDAVHLGLTATPYPADGRGLGDAYQELVVVASPSELIAEGFLVAPSVFTVPGEHLPDLSSVHVRAGDYESKQLEDAVNRKALIGNIVEHWVQLANGKRTVAFAVSVEHSKHIAERFREAGVAAEHLDGTTPGDERDAILARLDAGTTLIVANCGVLCLDSQTEILTVAGWRTFDSIRVDDLVAGWISGRVEFEPPLAIHRRERLPGERMVSLRGRSLDLRVTEGHGIVYRTVRRGTWSKAPARERVGLPGDLPACGVARPCPVEMPPRRIWSRRAVAKALSHTRWNIHHGCRSVTDESSLNFSWTRTSPVTFSSCAGFNSFG